MRESSLVIGPDDASRSPNWDADWRRKLVDNLAILVRQLRQVGVSEIFVDGSFAEDKDHPNDIDGYFECDVKLRLRLEQELNRHDPHKTWTWNLASRRWAGETGKNELPMWHQYRVELYPHYGQSSGIEDAFGNELEFPAAFRQSQRKRGMPKGIIKIVHDN